jgi:hypothetical protein
VDRTTRATLRVLAILASTLLGLTGLALFPHPAAATTDTTVSGTCAWDADATAWAVDWTVTPVAPAGASTFILHDVTAAPEGVGAGSELGAGPHEAGSPLDIRQLVPDTGDTPTPQLSLTVIWDDPAATPEEWSGQTECRPRDLPDLISGFSYDCRALTITVRNPDSERVRLTFVPEDGESFGVDVAGGESANVRFPAGAGQSVDVRLDGYSVVDPAEPITITSADWEQLDCEYEEVDEALGLAATGSRIALVAVAAVALLGLGGGLYLVARRRRIRFTA